MRHLFTTLMMLCIMASTSFAQLSLNLSYPNPLDFDSPLTEETLAQSSSLSLENNTKKDKDAEAFFQAADLLLGMSLLLSLDGLGGEDSELSTTQLLFAPCLWYFLTNRLALGARVGLDYRRSSRTFSTDEQVDTRALFILEPFVRYFYYCGLRTALYTEAGIGLQFGNNKNEFGGEESKSSLFNLRLALAVGGIYHISSRFFLYSQFGALQYLSSSSKPDGGESSTRGNFSLNLLTKSLTIGAVFLLNGSRTPAAR